MLVTAQHTGSMLSAEPLPQPRSHLLNVAISRFWEMDKESILQCLPPLGICINLITPQNHKPFSKYRHTMVRVPT